MYDGYMNKICTGCLEEKPEELFSWKKGRRNSRCKECVRKYYQNYYHGSEVRRESVKKAVNKYKEVNRVKLLAKRYNTTEDCINDALDKYSGKCHICKNREATDIDHCHKTGEVRGALCGPCNKGLGFLGDSETLLLSAIEYLHAAVSPLPDKK